MRNSTLIGLTQFLNDSLRSTCCWWGFKPRRNTQAKTLQREVRKSCLIYAILIVCLFVVGCASKEVAPKPVEMSTAPAVSLLITPAEILTAGEPVELQVVGFDADGKRTETLGELQWATMGLEGTLQPIPFAPDEVVTKTAFTPDKNAGAHAGTVHVEFSEDRQATARGPRDSTHSRGQRILRRLHSKRYPTHWIGATGKFFVREKDGNKILVKPPPQRGLDRSNVYIGPSTMKNYQIQVDLFGTRNKRRLPDMGLIANRYTLDMQGRHQRLTNPFLGIRFTDGKNN